VLHGLLVGQPAAEHLAVERPPAEQVEGALHLAEPAHHVVDAARAEPLLRDPEAVARLAERVLDGDPDAVVGDLAVRRPAAAAVAEHGDRRDRQPGGVGRHQELRVAAVRGRVRVGQRHHDAEPGVLGAAREPLDPVQHPLVALADGAHPELRRVGAADVGLRHREEGARRPLDERPQEPLLLLGRPEVVEDLPVARIGRLAVEDVLAPDRPADLLVQVRVGEEALAAAAGLGRQVRGPEAGLLRPRAQVDQEPLRLVVFPRDLRLDREEVLVHERPVRRAQLLVASGSRLRRRRHGSSIAGVRLGVMIGYASPGTNPADLAAVAQEAESLGYASAWVAETWGTDAVSVIAWLLAHTTRIDVGAGIMQIPARPPTLTAMSAATLDLLSGGRFLLGLGVSGPQVAEGWYGVAWGPPLARTREYVAIVRAALRREVVV